MTKREINGTLSPLTTTTTSNHTVNYDLPLWEGQDVTSWLQQMNDAMDKIDTGIHDVSMDSVAINETVNKALETSEAALSQIEEATKDVQPLLEQMRVAQANIIVNKNNITALQEASANQDTEIHSLQMLTDSMQDDISNLSDKVAGIAGTVSVISATVYQLVEKVENIPEDVTRFSEDIEKLTQSVNQNEKAIITVTEAVQAINTNLADAEADINKNIGDIADLKTDYKGANTNISQLQTEILNLANADKTLETAIKQNETEITTTAEAVETNSQAIVSNTAEINKVKGQIANIVIPKWNTEEIFPIANIGNSAQFQITTVENVVYVLIRSGRRLDATNIQYALGQIYEDVNGTIPISEHLTNTLNKYFKNRPLSGYIGLGFHGEIEYSASVMDIFIPGNGYFFYSITPSGINYHTMVEVTGETEADSCLMLGKTDNEMRIYCSYMIAPNMRYKNIFIGGE